MKYLITMLAVSIFSCAITAQTPHLKTDKGASSQKTWGHKEQTEQGKVHKAICLWQEKKAPVRHDVPIVCGKGDGKCGVRDCKCSCHKKGTKRYNHKKSASKGRTSRSNRGHRRSGHWGRSSRFDSKRGSSRRSHTRSHARKGPPTKTAKNSKKVRDTKKKSWHNTNRSERKKWSENIRKRIEKWRKEHSK